jgi:hypothetical protein
VFDVPSPQSTVHLAPALQPTKQLFACPQSTVQSPSQVTSHDSATWQSTFVPGPAVTVQEVFDWWQSTLELGPTETLHVPLLWQSTELSVPVVPAQVVAEWQSSAH